MKINLKRLNYGLLCFAVLAGMVLVLCLNSGLVQAQSGELAPQAAGTPRPTPQYTQLENLLKREQITLANQQERINLSDQVVTKCQQMIAKLNAAGKDTSTLVAGLAAFSQALADTKTLHAAAAASIASPAGFGASGQVTDAKQAAETLRNAGQSLRQAHLKITSATLDLRILVRNYVSANKK